MDWCEEHCDFHSIDEGVARDEMEADQMKHGKLLFIWKRITRSGRYRLEPVTFSMICMRMMSRLRLEFSSSQIESDGLVIGYYDGKP